MGRYAAELRRDLAELERELRTLDEHGTAALPAVVPAIRRYLRTDVSIAYELSSREQGLVMDYLAVDGPRHAQLARATKRVLAAETPEGFFAFDMMHPARPHRNRALRIVDLPRPGGAVVREKFDVVFAPLGYADQLRTLLCEGPVLLAFVGAFSREPFTVAERRRLTAAIPALQRRVRLDRRLRDAALARAAIAPLLEAIGTAAFIEDDRGHIQFANALAARQLARRGGLARAADLDQFAIEAPGMKPHALRVQRRVAGDPAPRVASAVRRWGLTARQADVLALVARGLGNKEIAALLRCAEHTVEVHVSRVLRAADCPSRSALVAKFWTELST